MFLQIFMDIDLLVILFGIAGLASLYIELKSKPIAKYIRLPLFVFTLLCAIVLLTFLVVNYNDKMSQFWNIYLLSASVIINFIYFIISLIKRKKNSLAKILYLRPNNIDDNNAFWDEFKNSLTELGIDEKMDIDEKTFNQIRYTNFKKYKSIIITQPNKDTVEFIVKNGLVTRIVFHDISTRADINDIFLESSQMAHPPIVTINNIIGAKLAAKLMYNHLIKQFPNQNDIRVLILKGEETLLHSHERSENFEVKIKKLFNENYPEKNIHIESLGFCNYRKDIAGSEFRKFYNKNKSNLKINGIFACNDAMALGVDEEITRILANNGTLTSDIRSILKNIIIIGFDNIKGLQQIAKSQDSRIFGSIDSLVQGQASSVISMVKAVINNRLTTNRSIQVEPVIKEYKTN